MMKVIARGMNGSMKTKRPTWLSCYFLYSLHSITVRVLFKTPHVALRLWQVRPCQILAWMHSCMNGRGGHADRKPLTRHNSMQAATERNAAQLPNAIYGIDGANAM